MIYKVFNIKAILFSIAALFTIRVYSQTVETFFAGSYTYTCPAGVNSITVQCWGGGGGGGGAAFVLNAAGGGGGGGTYASSVITVIPGNTYNLVVGSGGFNGGATGTAGGNGNNTSFNTNVVMAVGGIGGGGATSTAAGTAGAGGLSTSCIGTIRYSGGNGASGTPTLYGGGGGSSAGTSTNGNPANTYIGGNPPIGGGIGASSSTLSTGAAGAFGGSPGGGGSGARRGSNATNYPGNNGGGGKMLLSYCSTNDGGSTIPTNQTICIGQLPSSLSLSGAVGTTYQWQSSNTSGASWTNISGATASTLNNGQMGAPTATTWYRALVTNGSCPAVASNYAVVNVNPYPMFSVNSAAICAGSSAVLTASGGAGGTIYNWSPATGLNTTTGPSVTSSVLATTQYIVTATLNGCSTNVTTTVTVNANPSITTTQTNVTCFGGSDGLINATVIGGVQISQTAVVDQQQTTGGCGTTTGNFWQSFTPAISGQFSSIDVQISTNVANVGTWYVYSGAGQSGTLLASGSYNIPTSGGAQWRTISIAGTPLLLAGQQYTFRMSSVDWSQACGGNVYAGGTNQNGNGDLVFRTYMIPNPYTYSWSNGAVTEDISNLTAGSYTLTVTDAASCSASNTAIITSPGVLAITASASPTAICAGSTSTLTAFGPLTLDQYSNTGSTTGKWFGSNIGQQTFIAGYTGLLRKIRLQTATYSGASGNIVVNLYAGTYGSGTLLKTVTYNKPLGTNSWDDIIIPGGVNLTVGSPYYIEIPAGPQIDWIHSSSDTYVNGSGWWAGSNQTWDWNFETYMDLNTYVWNPGPLSNPVVSVSPSITTNYTVAVTSVQSCSNSQIVTVNVDPASVAGTASANQSICTGQVPSAITLTGFTGAIQWQSSPNNSTWTNITGATTNVLSSAQIGALSSTTYYRATVTSGLCAAALSNVIVITVNPFPTITATSSSTAICVGFTASLTGTGALSYIWNPGSLTGTMTSGVSTLNVSPSVTTVYTLTGTSAAGCTNTQTVSLTVNNNPTVTATTSSSAICVGFTASLTATGASTYTWNPGPLTGSLVSVSPSATTIYTLTGASAAGCIKTQTVSLAINNNPTVTATSSPTAICIGASANLTATGAASYSWNPGPLTGSLVSVSPSATTIYTLTGTSAAGCVNSKTISLTVNPNLPLSTSISSSTTTICSGSSVSFFSTQTNAGSSPTYQWQLNGSNIPGATFATYGTIALNNNDVISLKMTANEVCTTNSPAYSNSITMTVNPNLPLSTSISSFSTTICQGTTLSFFSTQTNAGTSPTYQWLLNGNNIPGATFATYSSNTLNDYDAISLMMTANELCTTNSPAYSNAISITVNSNPVLNLNASSNSICLGSSSTLIASGADSYTWTPGLVSGSIITVTPTVNTTYVVEGENSSGCFTSDSIFIVVNPLPIANAALPSSDSICYNGAVGLALNSQAGITSFSWTSSYGATINAQNPTFTNVVNVGNVYYYGSVEDGNGCVSLVDTVLVVVAPSLTLSALPTNVSCFGSAIGSINLSVLGGFAPYSYSWSNSALTEDLSLLPAGNYSVTVNDASTCSASLSVNITQPTQLDAIVNITTPIACNGGNAVVNITATGGTGPYTGAGTYTVDAGNYTFTVYDNNDCTSTTTITIVEPTQLVASVNISTPIACNGGNAILTVTATGGTGPYTGAGTYTVAAGNYTYTVTDANGCSSTTTISVTEPTLLVASSAISSAILCNGGSAIIAVTSTGGTVPYMGTGTYTVAAGNYTYTVTDANACTSITTITVSEPTQIVATANITSPITCNGGNAILTVSASGGAGSYAGIGTYTVAAGNYTYTVTDANGCTSTTTISVTEPTLLVASSAISSAILCNGGSAIIAVTATGGTGPYTGAGTYTVAAGNYTYTVTDANSCTSTTTISVTEPTLLVASSAISSAILCNGGSALIAVTATGGTVPYMGIGTYTVAAGNYTYTVTDANGCSIATTVNVTEPTPIVANVNIISPIACNGGNAILTVSASGGAGSYAGIGTYTVAAGNYTYTVTDANGCTSTTTISVTEPTLLVASSAISSAILCNGGSAIIAVTATGGIGPYTGAGTYTVAAGNYTYTVADANGCSSTTTISVTEPTLLVASSAISSAILCNGGSGIIAVTATGGTGLYSGTGTFTVAAGNYTYTVADANGCSSTTTISVTQPTPIVANVSITAPISCNGGNAILMVTASGGAGSYAGTGTYTVAAGNYTYTVTDANSCSSSVTISVTEPTLLVASSVISSAILCNGGSAIIAVTATGGIGPYTGAGTYTVAAGNYTYTVADANGCSSTTTITVTEPTQIVATANITTPIACNGGNAILTVTATGGAGPYAGAGTFTVAAGNYTYTVADANGCSSTTTIAVTEPTQIVATANITTPIACNGGNAVVTLSATGGIGAYTGTGTYTVTAGNYTYTVTDANGCTNTQTITVTEPTQLVASVNITTPIACNGGNGVVTVSATGGTGAYTGTGTYTVAAGNYTYTVTDANGCTNTQTTTITEPTQLVASVNMTTPIACNGGNGVVTVSATGGAGSYTGTGTFTVAAGNYTYTVTDANGCTNTKNITVTEPTQLVASVNITTPIACNGGNVVVTVSATGGTGAYTGTGTYTVTAGNYTYSLTDANGCTNTQTITVTEPTPIIANVSITSPIACNGGNAILTVSAAGGTGSYSGTGTFTVTAGNYTYTVTDVNSCSSTLTISVTEPTPLLLTVSATNNTICIGQNTILNGTGVNTYTWSPGLLVGASVTVTPNSITTYTVNGTNGAGCIGTQTISINVNSLPVVNAGASQTICTGQFVTLTGTGSATSYTWNNGVVNNIAFTPTLSNSYIVVGTDVNSCLNTDTVEVIINPILSLSLSASTNSICFGNSVILSANGATTYTWNPGLLSGASVTVNPTSNTTYSVNGDNGTGCVGTETISLLVQQLPNVLANASSTNICVGQTVSLTGSGATNYNWNNGVIDGIAFSPTTTNSYIVEGTDIFGCTATTTILVNVYSGTAAIPSVNPGIICIGDTSYLSVIGGSIPTWSLNSNPNLLNVAPLTDVSYTYSAVDDNGCIGDIIFNISIDEACAITVYNGFTPNGDGINDFWIIDNIENYSNNKVYIYNRWGTLMFSTSNYNNFDNVWDGKFNDQAVTSGTYFYVIESNQLIKKGWIEITN